MRAYLNLRHEGNDRWQAFEAGLRAIGCSDIRRGYGTDAMLVTWNRIGGADHAADVVEAAGLPVLVAENASWGSVVPRHIHVSRTRHSTVGTYPVGGPERWDALGIDLDEWRPAGGETVILAQRGIGSPHTAVPRIWSSTVAGRVRRHPGKSGPPVDLKEDLANASLIRTWGSAAAVQALAWGIPVESHMPHWIGEQDNTDQGRLSMFRRMAWAQWTLAEIATGEAFRWLLA